MLSTGRLLRATKLLCDFKVIKGTEKCSFHVYAVNNSTICKNYVLRRKQPPIAYGFFKFASTEASVEPANHVSQVMHSAVGNSDNSDTKLLRELGILPPNENVDTLPVEDISVAKEMELIANCEVHSDSIDLSAPESSNEVYQNPTSTVAACSFADVKIESVSDVRLEFSGSEISSEAPEQHLEGDILNFSSSDTSDRMEQLTKDSNIPELVMESSELALESSVVEFSNTPEPSLEPTHSSSSSEVSADVVVSSTPEVSSIANVIPDTNVASPEVISAAADVVGRFASEPSLESIGLGGYSPVGLVQHVLTSFHMGLDLPWWGAIALGTLIIRTIVFPLVIMSQRNAAKMNNCMPEMQLIQVKMSDARQRGDRLDAARYAQELVQFMGEKGLNPIKNMIVPLCQAPFFISMFMGLRQMSNTPVESFHTGGLWWFTDLTLPDQFYLLPLITSVTLLLTVEIGTDMGRLNASNMGLAKYFLRAMPVIIFPFTINFPSGVLVYWCSTNFISLIQVAILRVPAVRDYFKIEQLMKFDKKTLPIKDKGFVGGVKESWTNMKISRELEERERLDKANFLQAGRGAVRKTYKYDPTQPRPPRNLSSIQLRKRD